jgi:hypothetical protein
MKGDINMKWKINLGILKKCKELGHCVCDLSKPCPCDDFLERMDCRCGAFKKIEDGDDLK